MVRDHKLSDRSTATEFTSRRVSLLYRSRSAVVRGAGCKIPAEAAALLQPDAEGPVLRGSANWKVFVQAMALVTGVDDA